MCACRRMVGLYAGMPMFQDSFVHRYRERENLLKRESGSVYARSPLQQGFFVLFLSKCT